jgi:acetyl-CoA carboxylase carboxyltransferase component
VTQKKSTPHAPAPGDASFIEQARLIEAAKAGLLDPARAESLARQRQRGKLTARERIARLVDEESFDEYGALVSRIDGTPADAPTDGVITGIGAIGSRPVAVMSQDFSVFGGSIGHMGGQKMLRLVRQCLQSGTPLILLLDGGGHRIQDGQDSWQYASGGSLMHDLVRLSGWVPVVTAILGDGFAAGTNFAGLSDFVVMVRGLSTMGLAGPALVKAATGEEITKEELGGAETQVDRHGLAHAGVDSEDEALATIRRYLSFLPSNAQAAPATLPCIDPAGRRCQDFAKCVPADSRQPYDVRRVIRELADRDSTFEIQPGFAANAVTAFARMQGRSVGFIANQPQKLGGILNSPACEKIAHFVAVCDAYGLPLIYLIDVPGFYIGSAAEKTLLGRRSAKMLYELGHATVPRISVVLRKGYGLGYFAMAGGRGFEADVSLAWPTAEICAMSIDGSVDVAYRKDYQVAEDPPARRRELIEGIRRLVTPMRAAGGFGVDDVIDPADTRRYLNAVLARVPARRAPSMPPKWRSIAPI